MVVSTVSRWQESFQVDNSIINTIASNWKHLTQLAYVLNLHNNEAKIPQIPVPVAKTKLSTVKRDRLPIGRCCVQDPLGSIHLRKMFWIRKDQNAFFHKHGHCHYSLAITINIMTDYWKSWDCVFNVIQVQGTRGKKCGFFKTECFEADS